MTIEGRKAVLRILQAINLPQIIDLREREFRKRFSYFWIFFRVRRLKEEKSIIFGNLSDCLFCYET